MLTPRQENLSNVMHNTRKRPPAVALDKLNSYWKSLGIRRIAPATGQSYPEARRRMPESA